MFTKTEKCLVECFGESLILHLKAFSDSNDMIVVRISKEDETNKKIFNALGHCCFNAYVTYEILTNKLVDWCVVPSTGFELSSYYEEHMHDIGENGLKKSVYFIDNNGFIFLFSPNNSCFVYLGDEKDDSYDIYINDYELKCSLTMLKPEVDIKEY